MRILSGRSNTILAEKIAHHAQQSLLEREIISFNDSELSVRIQENVHSHNIFVIQSLTSPINDHLMELLIMIDALKRSHVHNISAVIPYFGYARQDRQTVPQTPITAKLVADLITTAGAHQVITVDLHTPQMQGFFSIPVTHLSATQLFIEDILKRFTPHDIIIMAPDVGCIPRVRTIAKELGCPMGVIDKWRQGPAQSQVMHVMGQVRDKICIFIDDIMDSGTTLYQAAEAVLQQEATSVHAYVTHGVLSQGIAFLEQSSLNTLTVTNSIPQTHHPKINILDIAPLLVETMS